MRKIILWHFKPLCTLYHEMLYWHIRKLVLVHEDADDVLQNTYIKIYKGIKKLQAKKQCKDVGVSNCLQ